MNHWTMHSFDGWFTIELPDLWETETDEVISFYSSADGEGTLQISLFHRKKDIIKTKEFLKDQVNRFVKQQSLTNIKEIKIVSSEFETLCVEGLSGTDFMIIWTIANETKFLLITYIAKNKTNEIETVNDIVCSIKLLET